MMYGGTAFPILGDQEGGKIRLFSIDHILTSIDNVLSETSPGYAIAPQECKPFPTLTLLAIAGIGTM